MQLISSKERTSFISAMVCLCALMAPAMAEEAVKVSPLDKELEMVRKLISNAQIKLRRGVVGVAPAGEAKDMVRTPGRMCCGDNIDRIHKGLDKIREMIRERGTCFEQKWDRGGTEAVTMATQDLRTVGVGIQAFTNARELEDTYGALDGTLRAYLNLKRRIDVLPPCASGAPAPKK